MSSITYADMAVLNFIHTHFTNPFLDGFFSLVTHLGDFGIFWIAAGLLLLIKKNTRKIGACMLISLVLGLIFTNLGLKNIVARTRPFYNDGALVTADNLLVAPPHDFSFPSGHTTASFAAAVSVFLKDKRRGAVALLIAFLIALSRLYLYVHMPTDVLAGAAIGVLSAFLASCIVRRFKKFS